MTPANLAPLAALPRLELLSLVGCDVDNAILAVFTEFRALGAVDLRSTRVTPPSPTEPTSPSRTESRGRFQGEALRHHDIAVRSPGRVVAAEVGEPVELINTATEAGQAALRQLTPIAKVPVAILDGRCVFDSRDHRLADHDAWLGRDRPPRSRWHSANLVNAIDGALEAQTLFHLARDGHDLAGWAYGTKRHARTAAILDWPAAS